MSWLENVIAGVWTFLGTGLLHGSALFAIAALLSITVLRRAAPAGQFIDATSERHEQRLRSVDQCIEAPIQRHRGALTRKHAAAFGAARRQDRPSEAFDTRNGQKQ